MKSFLHLNLVSEGMYLYRDGTTEDGIAVRHPSAAVKDSEWTRYGV